MPITRIVVGVDGSEGSAKAVALACELAAATGAEVVAVHAFEPLSYVGKIEPPLDFPKIKQQTEELLRTEWCRPFEEAGLAYRTLVVDDDPVHALVYAATNEAADMIVVGTRGIGGVRGMVVGSVASKLPSTSPVPVTIVPPG